MTALNQLAAALSLVAEAGHSALCESAFNLIGPDNTHAENEMLCALEKKHNDAAMESHNEYTTRLGMKRWQDR